MTPYRDAAPVASSESIPAIRPPILARFTGSAGAVAGLVSVIALLVIGALLLHASSSREARESREMRLPRRNEYRACKEQRAVPCTIDNYAPTGCFECVEYSGPRSAPR